MTLPATTLYLITLLEQAGFSAYVVGGCVRDSLLGNTPSDWDLCTCAIPEQVSAVLQTAGITVHQTGLQHGTITAVLDHKPYEITTFRTESTYTDHRRPDAVQFTKNLHKDLARRDFTVNAMAFHPLRGLIDPFGGQQDLQAGIIKCVGAPTQRFEEDALRILRALRFASTLGFTLEAQTAHAAHKTCATLNLIAKERIAVELTKLLCGKHVREVLLAHREIIFAVLPQLRELSGFDQHTPWHCYDVYEHSCVAVEAVPPEPHLRWAALLHDIGKPACFFMRDGTGHFHGHPQVSERIAHNICDYLKFSRKLKEQVLTLVANHELRLLEDDVKPTRLRKLLGKFGEATLLDLLLLNRADVTAQAPEKRDRLKNYEPIRQAVLDLVHQAVCVTRKQLAINGDDLISLGLHGTSLGNMLNLLLQEVLEGRLVNDRKILLAWAVDNSHKI